MKKIVSFCIILFLCFVFFTAFFTESLDTLDTTRNFNYKTSKLAHIKFRSSHSNFPFGQGEIIPVISRNGLRCVYTVLGTLVDKRKEKKYKEIRNVILTDDGLHLAYIATENEECFLVCDGKEGKHYKNLAIHDAIISKDAKKSAYGVFDKLKRESFLVVNDSGKEVISNRYPIFDHLTFSDNGKTLTYIATEKGDSNTSCVIRNNTVVSKSYPSMFGLVIHPNLQSFACIARNSPNILEGFIVKDRQEIGKYKKYVSLSFSPDGKNLAAYVQEKGMYEETGHTKQGYPILGFSKNPVGYIIEINEKGDFKEGNHYPFVSTPFYSSTGELAYLATKTKDYSPEQKLECFNCIVWDNIESSCYHLIDQKNIVFSPDGKKIGFVATSRKNSLERGFSQKNGIIVWDKNKEKWIDFGNRKFVGPLVFSPDNNFICYGAIEGSAIWWIVEKL